MDLSRLLVEKISATRQISRYGDKVSTTPRAIQLQSSQITVIIPKRFSCISIEARNFHMKSF